MKVIKGRGAQINTPKPFDSTTTVSSDDGLGHWYRDEVCDPKTRVVETTAKRIVNKVDSPDVGFPYSLNPYQGCEHGCVYCYARNTHTYWGYSAGIDFETTILVKTNAVDLLRHKLSSSRWQAAPIMLSGNTDCYQPVERQYGITRQLLALFLEFKHPVAITTKNALILRDIDLLQKLAEHNLVSVAISINTLDDDQRQLMEPRATTISKRLQVVRKLSEAGIPVTVLAAPIIPGLNDHNILPLVKKVSEMGARRIVPLVVRLNGDVEEIFKDWLHRTHPDRAQKVINKIKSLHGGKVSSSTFGERTKGQGIIADIIRQQFDLARRLYCMDGGNFEFNCDIYDHTRSPQLSLFAS